MRSSELTPLKAAILDAVRAAGADGITAGDLVRVAYQGRIGLPDPRTLKSHVSQLNDWLADSGQVIRSDGYRTGGPTPRYRLVQRRAVQRRKAKGAAP